MSIVMLYFVIGMSRTESNIGCFDHSPDEFEDLSEEEQKTRATMNREQRRAADKRRKKKKLPYKGFGKQD